MGYVISLLLLMVATIHDVKERRIPNKLVLLGLSIGILLNMTMTDRGVLFSFMGMLVGLILLVIPYSMGGIGAGDVKLLASIGSILGPIAVMNVFAWTAIVGAVFALVLIVREQKLILCLRKFRAYILTIFFLGRKIIDYGEGAVQSSIPYALPMLIGFVLMMMFERYIGIVLLQF